MGFVKTPEELNELKRESFDFYDAEFLAVYWETKPEIVEKLLPPPLKSMETPPINYSPYKSQTSIFKFYNTYFSFIRYLSNKFLPEF